MLLLILKIAIVYAVLGIPVLFFVDRFYVSRGHSGIGDQFQEIRDGIYDWDTLGALFLAWLLWFALPFMVLETLIQDYKRNKQL